jgi:excisionase family DNA binding protein
VLRLPAKHLVQSIRLHALLCLDITGAEVILITAQLVGRSFIPGRCWELEMDMDDRWLSVEEIAEYLGIKRDTVYKWIRRKDMPAHKMGSLWKFRKDEVDDWVMSGQAASGSPDRGEISE